jgi:hypothetical protein
MAEHVAVDSRIKIPNQAISCQITFLHYLHFITCFLVVFLARKHKHTIDCIFTDCNLILSQPLAVVYKYNINKTQNNVQMDK